MRNGPRYARGFKIIAIWRLINNTLIMRKQLSLSRLRFDKYAIKSNQKLWKFKRVDVFRSDNERHWLFDDLFMQEIQAPVVIWLHNVFHSRSAGFIMKRELQTPPSVNGLPFINTSGTNSVHVIILQTFSKTGFSTMGNVTTLDQTVSFMYAVSYHRSRRFRRLTFVFVHRLV